MTILTTRTVHLLIDVVVMVTVGHNNFSTVIATVSLITVTELERLAVQTPAIEDRTRCIDRYHFE